MTLLTQATDVFAAAETGDRSVVVFPAHRQAGTAAVFGPREFATVGALDAGAGRAWGIVVLPKWNDIDQRRRRGGRRVTALDPAVEEADVPSAGERWTGLLGTAGSCWCWPGSSSPSGSTSSSAARGSRDDRGSRQFHSQERTMTLRSLAAAASIAASASAAEPSALVLGVTGGPFHQALACGAQVKAREFRLRLAEFAPEQFAADNQVPVLNAVGAAAPDVAVVVPTDARALIAPMRQLAERGAKLITVDQTVADPALIHRQIVTENAQGGGLAAWAMARLFGGKGDCR